MTDPRSDVVQAIGQPAANTVTPIDGRGSHEEFKQLTQQLVGSLRERGPGGLRGVLSPLLAERDRALADELSRHGAAILESYDWLILNCIVDALRRSRLGRQRN